MRTLSRTRVIFSLILALGILIATLSSCDHRKKSEDSTGDNATYSLKIGAMPSMDILPFLVAQKIGVYDSLGLNLEVIKFYSAVDRDAALQSQNIDGSVTDFTGAIMQHAAGIPLRVVMKLDGFFHLITRPGLPAQDLTALGGTKIGISRNTVIEYATDMMLRSAGLSESKVTKVDIPKIPLRMEMLRGGKIDASVLPDPFISITRKEGMKSLASTQEMGIQVTGLVLSEKALEEEVEAVKLLLKGYDLGVDYITSHSIEDYREILTDVLGFPSDVLSDIVLPGFSHCEKPSSENIMLTINWLKGRSLIPEDYDPSELVAEVKE